LGVTVRTFSYTKIATYEQCPQKYKFRYIDELRPTHQTIEQLFGQTVHLCLRKLHEDTQAGRTVSEEEIADYYAARWKEGFCTSTKIVRRGATEKDYFESGKKMVLSYDRRVQPIDAKTLVGVELELNFPLAERVSFQGVIDRLVRREPGLYEIHDYKTSRRLPSPRELKENKQLLLYEIGLRHRHPDAQRVLLVWHYLAHDKEIRVEKSSEQLALAKDYVLKTIARIAEHGPFQRKLRPFAIGASTVACVRR
jgi:putative RecB family exonuclease